MTKMKFCILNLCCLIVILYSSQCFGAPSEDLVSNLPGLNYATNYNQYSGYLQATENRRLHYWLVESQNDSATDPLILWLNGGPGCSSLLGLLTELGPFYVDQAGSGELHPNPYSWNTFANVFFLESPACVGFSYDTSGGCGTVNDNITARENYAALQDFFNNKFPEYSTRDFYITGESYAGIYIPTLSTLILDGIASFPINFQGFAIGNGYFDIPSNTNSLVYYTYYHSVIGDTLWNNLIDNCCDGSGTSRDHCQFYNDGTPTVECLNYAAEVIIRVDANGLIPYNLYSQCGELTNISSDSRLYTELRTMWPNFNFEDLQNRPSTQDIINIDTYDPACSDNTPEKDYLNSAETRAALNIVAESDDWRPCSNVVNLEYRRTYDSVLNYIYSNIQQVRGLIYNGDVDMVCNFLGNEWCVEDFGLPVVETRRKWSSDGQVSGYVKRFQNLDFLTVKGAGHMVPGYKPPQSLHMIKSFIEQTDY